MVFVPLNHTDLNSLPLIEFIREITSLDLYGIKDNTYPETFVKMTHLHDHRYLSDISTFDSDAQ